MVIELLCTEDGDKYAGQYVAVESFHSKEVIANGKDPVKVCNKARKITDDPVVFYVPDPNVGYIYWDINLGAYNE